MIFQTPWRIQCKNYQKCKQIVERLNNSQPPCCFDCKQEKKRIAAKKAYEKKHQMDKN